MKKSTLLCVATLLPLLASASDFSGLLIFILIPAIILAFMVWAITWPATRGLKPRWLKTLIRVVGLCLIFTPTHTSGGNGQMLSVAILDIVLSGMGGDEVYAQQAGWNVLISTPVVYVIVLAVQLFGRKNNA